VANIMKIKAGEVTAEAELNDTRTAHLIWNALPLSARANRWGEEIYFEIPVKADLENAAELVNVGDLGYWPRGSAFCIFFGPTPMSRGNEIRPASAVNVIGKLRGDATRFRSVSDGEPVQLSRVK
jgi:hypothetical protein